MFQNIKIEWTENKTTKTAKPYKALAVLDESGAKFNVNIFSDFPDFANIIPGSVVRAKLEQNGQYWNLVSETQSKPRGGKPNFDRIIEKKQQGIADAQTEKAKNISLAQDKSAWMWAKNNASSLLAADANRVNGMNQDEMSEWVISLATKIYNGEPTEPF